MAVVLSGLGHEAYRDAGKETAVLFLPSGPDLSVDYTKMIMP